jgi:hypothetical protein
MLSGKSLQLFGHHALAFIIAADKGSEPANKEYEKYGNLTPRMGLESKIARRRR